MHLIGKVFKAISPKIPFLEQDSNCLYLDFKQYFLFEEFSEFHTKFLKFIKNFFFFALKDDIIFDFSIIRKFLKIISQFFNRFFR